jgi:hypothetical protein
MCYKFGEALHGEAEYQFVLVSDKEFSLGATSNILLYTATIKLCGGPHHKPFVRS